MANRIGHGLPQTAPISDMRNRQNELLDMTENGPVVLLSRSKPAAVLLSPSQWDAIATDDHPLIKANVKDGVLIPENDVILQPGQTYLVTVESVQQAQRPAIDALAAIAALAQPIGPPDLARNFDLYAERVLINETSE